MTTSFYSGSNSGTTSSTGTNLTNTSSTNQAQGSGSNMGVYNPQQQALQAQLPQTLMNIFNGQLPSSIFTAPPAAFDALNEHLQSQVDPQIANQFGAGSPQIGGQNALANEELAANLYGTQSSLMSSLLSDMQNAAFSSLGSKSNSLSSGSATGTGSEYDTSSGDSSSHFQQNNSMLGGLLSAVQTGFGF